MNNINQEKYALYECSSNNEHSYIMDGTKEEIIDHISNLCIENYSTDFSLDNIFSKFMKRKIIEYYESEWNINKIKAYNKSSNDFIIEKL